MSADQLNGSNNALGRFLKDHSDFKPNEIGRNAGLKQDFIVEARNRLRIENIQKVVVDGCASC